MRIVMASSGVDQYVVFRLGKEEYGFDVTNVREIQTMDRITTVHGSARYIEGVMNLRGKLITVINLRKRFGMEPTTEQSQSKIVIVEASDAPVGFIVDEVTEVANIPKATVEKVPLPIASKIESEYVIGIAKHSDRLITIIDPIKVLDMSVEPETKGA